MMNTFVRHLTAIALASTLAWWAIPIAAAQQSQALASAITPAAPPSEAPATIVGTAQSAAGQTVANVAVQLRDLATGQLAATTTSSPTGSYTFGGLEPGNYSVEIVNAAGQIVGASAAIQAAAGAVVSGVTVTASAAAAAVGGAAASGAAAAAGGGATAAAGGAAAAAGSAVAAAGTAAAAGVTTAVVVTAAAAAAQVAGAVAVAPEASSSR